MWPANQKYLPTGPIQIMFANPCLVEKTNISTNKFLCSVADRLSTVPSIYLSIACPVLIMFQVLEI